jgi:hypothetical protein
MNVGPQKRLTKRRKDLYNAIARGMTERKAIETIAKQYKTTEEAIYKDWQHRDKWGDIIPQIDKKNALQDVLNELDELRSRLYDKAANSKSDRDQIRALSILVDMKFKSLEALKELGFVVSAPSTPSAEDEVYYKILKDVVGRS